uniref:Uncharacterized protein n=1 Tax=Brassica oleracea var. oleracea TaxID=109376 RepID=A0A0D3A0I9_BRAOL
MTEHLLCKQMWHKINDLTNKLCGAFATAERQMTSGQNDTDLLRNGLALTLLSPPALQRENLVGKFPKLLTRMLVIMRFDQ